jgi:hypothetical protein
MPASEVARELDVRMGRICVDVLVARGARRQVLVGDRRHVGRNRRRERGAIDGVVDRFPHVHVGERRRALGVQRQVADARDGAWEPLLEASSGGVAVGPVELPEVVPRADSEPVIGDSGLDQRADAVLALAEVVLDRVPRLWARAVVVRVPARDQVVVHRELRDVVGPGRRNGTELLDRGQGVGTAHIKGIAIRSGSGLAARSGGSSACRRRP